MSKTRTATTAHGDVDYETVDCTSCENEVAKTDAQRFITGDVVEYHHWSHKNTKQYELDSQTVSTGWVCEYCREDPAQYPSKGRFTFNVSTEAAWALAFALIFSFGMVGAILL